ncbi:MAG: flavin reductase family protein, partial [Pseudomonadota bacterium]
DARPKPARDSMGADHRELRTAFGCYATGIAVVTCRAEDGSPVGMTVNSFTSVSLEPPLVLWCLDKSSHRFAPFAKAPSYAVNVLRAEQQDVSRAFAAPDAALEAEAFGVWKTGAPILLDCLAQFDCEVFERVDAGDHLLLVGRVVQFAAAEAGDPLIYYRSGYGSGVKR